METIRFVEKNEIKTVKPGETIQFDMQMSLTELINIEGIEGMNDYMDDFVWDNGMRDTLSDIEYDISPILPDEVNEVRIRVTGYYEG